LGVSSAEGLKGQSGANVTEIKSTGLAYCMMIDNVFPDAPSPLKDLNVRKALLMAIDRDAIGKSLYKGYAVTPGSQWPLITPGFNPDTKPLPYDPDGAQKLLSDAGQTNLKFTLNTYASTTVVADIQKLAEAIIAYWGQVGVKADLNVVDPSTFTTQWRNKQLHGAGMIAGPTAYYVEPTRVTATSFFGSQAPYSTIVGDAKLDGLIAQANNELDATKRTAIGRQIADYLDSQLWGLPIITTSSLVATGGNVASFGFIKAMPYAGPTTWIIAK
jgi:peptide/nickel transport system substrate-binding protein